MILTNRLFKRQAPSKTAKSLYIFCEGLDREYKYFNYFREKDSRINVEVHRLSHTDDNSPLGLFEIAKTNILSSEDNPNPKFKFQENDEVWIVLDTDPDRDESREAQINSVKNECSKLNNWFVSESNPCFEVWLYYHFNAEVPTLENDEVCKSWKTFVNDIVPGGFDSRKHPIFIEEAKNNSKSIYTEHNNRPLKSSTQVYNLAESILEIMIDKIRKVKNQLKGTNA